MAQPITPTSLHVKRFEPITAEKYGALVDFVIAGTLLDSPDLLLERTRLGTTATPMVEGGSSSSPYFRATVRRVADGAGITFKEGLVGGVEPRIGDRKISDTKTARKRPELIVTRDKFDEEGLARIYVQLAFDSTWAITKATIIASEKKRGDEVWMGHDLLGFIQRSESGSVRYRRMTHANHGHIALQRNNSNGIARHIYPFAP